MVPINHSLPGLQRLSMQKYRFLEAKAFDPLTSKTIVTNSLVKLSRTFVTSSSGMYDVGIRIELSQSASSCPSPSCYRGYSSSVSQMTVRRSIHPLVRFPRAVSRRDHCSDGAGYIQHGMAWRVGG